MRFVIIGGGPAGTEAATTAARLGVDVVLVERDVVGGAANLWDCVPSKAMIATGGAMSALSRIAGMGVTHAGGELDLPALASRITGITEHLEQTTTDILRSQQVELV
ncbi:MAG: FAD-dependent oxidoreductase, partial [Actinomycetota bacterium]|nr:FAD-dependent oxidoreductase [Actinomycetota bacterium]